MVKRAAIYDPYLDTLGGGERYCLTVAEILLKHGYKVDLFWSGNQDLIKKAQQRFSLNLENINLVEDVFKIKPKQIDLFEEEQNLFKAINRSLDPKKIHQKLISFINKLKITSKYDVFFYLGDGSIPVILGKQNFLHIQVPFSNEKNIFNKLITKSKLLLFSKIICNSQFTAKFYQDQLPSKITVVYPPIDVEKFETSDNKENIILSVGRFDNVLNAKKQDVLIDAFKALSEKENIKNWKLILAGGSLIDPDQNSYLKYLKEKSDNLSIEFIVNPNFEKLKEIYSKSKIYWHAAGFEVNEDDHPENTEHFGMTVVESMAAGLVPVVISKGGIPEIIEDGIDGYLWKTIDELVFKTKSLIESSSDLEKMSQKALVKCQNFSKANFEKEFLSLIKN
ncbi:MAG TPA: glycosyltransferase family 4 protein [Candidatus Woesebacteria bacterium]|nr:glycosyltransferase family 4 protein [Candidatus Woesebacteria bacterium]